MNPKRCPCGWSYRPASQFCGKCGAARVTWRDANRTTAVAWWMVKAFMLMNTVAVALALMVDSATTDATLRWYRGNNPSDADVATGALFTLGTIALSLVVWGAWVLIRRWRGWAVRPMPSFLWEMAYVMVWAVTLSTVGMFAFLHL